MESSEDNKPVHFDWMPEGREPLADGEYDAIVLGTGLTECIMSGLLSVLGMRVLQMDRNNYYGAEAASLSLTNLYEKFRGTEPPEFLGSNRDWNVDLIPKFIMACGRLVKILLHTQVTRYLEFKSVDGSYVYKDGKIKKVPATGEEALSSNLMGIFEKRKFRNFLNYLAQYDENDPSTFQGRDLPNMTMRDLYSDFGLDENTQAFVGHAMGLQTDDTYVNEGALPTVKAIQLYCFSLNQYGRSPYLYPVYGLGGLPEGFSRLCAINGGTFMLNTNVDEVLFNEDGVAWGVRSGNEVAKATMIIGDPSYFPGEKTRVVGQVVRSICILDHPIRDTNNAESIQLILPSRHTGRHNDIYCCMVSSSHLVAARGMYIAICSTRVETDNPAQELQPAIDLLGPIVERFDTVSDLVEPVNDGTADRCFVSRSYDETTHFESVAADVLSLYQRVTGQELDMTISADMSQEEG
jgi:Rab GDP dissociation inhibitor